MERLLLVLLSLVGLVKGEAGLPNVAWWIYIIVTLFVIAVAASITFCCCGCCGRFGCCKEDSNKEVTAEDVIMSQMSNNPYTNFQNPDEGDANGRNAEEEDVEEGKEVIQYEWSKEDAHTPAPYAL